MLLVSKSVRGEHKHFKLSFETYEDLPEFILHYYKDDIKNYKEILGL